MITFSTMNETSKGMQKAGRFYRLFVLVQSVVFIFAIPLLIWVPCSAPTARMHNADADLEGGLKTSLEMFKADCGRYPTTAEGLGILVFAPTNGSLKNYKGPYLDGIPEDPWGHPYAYRFPAVYSTNAYDLYSLGPDGITKSGGNDRDDVANWEKPWSPGITGDDLNGIAMLVLVTILFLFAIRLIVAAISSRFNALMEQNKFADRVWCAMAAIILLMAFFIPKLAG